MKKKKLISVIVPVYNEEKRIKKCVDSILNQTYKNIELIVIDDGSTDNTVNVLNSINDIRLKIISIENHGQGYARNLGISKAKGSLITFVDSDDYISINMIEKLYNNLIKNDSDISICNILKLIGNKQIPFKNIDLFFEDNNINYMISHPGPVGRLYKKLLFINNDIQFLENCIYEDLGTIPLLGLYTKKISSIDECLYYYVIRPNSSMNQVKYNSKLNDIFKVIEYLNSKFKEFGDEYFDVIEYLNIEHLLYSAHIRFISYKEGKEKCEYISNYIKKNYPNWQKNKILKKKSIKFKIYCFFASKNNIFVCKFFKNAGGK